MSDEENSADQPLHIHALLHATLYSPMDVTNQNPSMAALRYYGFQFDAHCVYCKDRSTFKTSKVTYKAEESFILSQSRVPGYFDTKATCTRHGHAYIYYFYLSKTSLVKIGQYPSLEDIAGADIEKYRSQLKDGAFSELRKATGLASHGIGIGAFVYLRRIFERLIYEHRDQLQAEKGPIDGFDSMRMEEKISALRSVLPAALVKHRSAYSILSKGLHELTEEECKLYFPVVRSSIIQMLEEDWIQRDRKRLEKSLEQELQRISTEINGPPSKPKAGQEN